MTEIALDCEWNRLGKLLCLAYLVYEDGKQVIKRVYPGNEYKLITSTLSHWKENKYLLIGHNIKSDILTIYENTSILLDNPTFDTMIAFQQLTNGKKQEGKNISATYGNVCKLILGKELDKSLQSSFLDKYDYDFTDEELVYIQNDIEYLYPLKQKLEGILTKLDMIGNGIIPKSFTLDNLVIAPLVDIEHYGMRIDSEKWSKLVDKWEEEKEELHTQLIEELTRLDYPVKIQKLQGKKTVEEDINLNSHIQVKALFKHFNIKLPVNQEGKESTNKDLLASINIDNPENKLSNFIDIFINYKIKSKLISAFGKNIIDNLRNGQTLHTDYTIAFTSTGRLSSGQNKLKKYTINVQNIPARSEAGKDIMECIVARESYNIICCDLSGCELRIAGSRSKDKVLLDNFNAGGDFHSELATCSWQAINNNTEVISKKFNPKWLDTDFRTIHKQVNFGLLYGCSAKRISEVLHIPKNIAEKCKQAIEKKVPKLMNYLKSNQKLAKDKGYFRSTFTNRIRYNLTSTEASNWEIQNANAEIMKLALYKIWKHIQDNNIDAHIINTVHDSIIVEVKEGVDYSFIQDIMADTLSLFLEGIKGEADISVAKYWKK